MSVSELFHQSVLLNALIFLWLASAVSATRILIRGETKASTALILSIILGPIAFMGAWVFETLVATKKRPDGGLAKKHSLIISSVISIILVCGLIIGIFYYLFVFEYALSDISSESLLVNISIAIMLLGIVGGVVLSAITGRVAFFESCWCSAILAFSLLALKNWASDIFSYGTSAAYFMTLILTSTALLLLFLTLGGSLGYLMFGEGRLNLRFGYESFIGARFLMTKRSSQVVSLITVITVMAVTIACVGMIVVMSVMNGFTADLRSKIIGANAHLMVFKYGKDFSEYKSVIEKTKDIFGVTGANPFVLNEGMVSSAKNLSGAIITGIETDSEKKSSQMMKYVSEKSLHDLNSPEKIPVVSERGYKRMFDEPKTDGEIKTNDLPGVIIGKEMASDLQVFTGDTVNIISPVGEIGPTGPIPKAKQFRVAGLFYSGMYEYDAKFAFIKLAEAQEFFGLKDAVSGVEYRVDDIENTRAIAKQIEAAIGGYPFYTRDWMQMNRNIFSALQIEKIAMMVILGTLIFMASLLILATLIMVVMEKGKEIAILKSMGASDASIMKIFVTYGLSVGTMGAILGGGLGLGLCLLIEKIGIRLDPDVYYFSNLPVRIVLSEVLMVVSSAILISFLATVPPSLFAARLKPVEGLRYE